MRNPCLLVLLLGLLSRTAAQEAREVADLTLRIAPKQEENLYYAFAPGDDIIFTAIEASGKPLKEIEISEWPDVSKFRDFETSAVRDKRLKVDRAGVYRFRLANTALLGERVVRVQIWRVPAADQWQDYATGVRWVERYDTIYDIRGENQVVRYDTVPRERTRRVLTGTDTSLVTLVDRTERVHSSTNPWDDNKTWIHFTLPSPTPRADGPAEESGETIAWVYTVAVGSEGSSWLNNANVKAAAKGIIGLATKTGLVATGYGAIALLAVEGISMFSNPPSGDNVKFAVNHGPTDALRNLAHGNSVAAVGRFTEPLQGPITIQLENDNYVSAINVDVKAAAVVLHRRYREETYREPVVVPVTKKDLVKPTLKKVLVPVRNQD